MGKKTLGVITIVLITGLLASWYFFTRESKYFNTSAFNAVPVNSSIILRIHDLPSFSEKVSGNSILNEYSKIPGYTAMLAEIHFADSLINHNPDVKKLFTGKDLTVAVSEDQTKSGILYLLELYGVAERNNLSRLISDYFTQRKASSVKQKSGDASFTIYYWSEGPNMTTFSISFYKGICIASNDTALVTQAIKQLDLPSLAEDQEFQKVYKTASPNSDLNIYLNHKTLIKYISSVFSDSFFKPFRNSPQNVTWSEIDLTHKPDELLFNGFTFAKDSLNSFPDILLHQKPGKFNLEKYFPDETSFFLCLNLENPALYFKDYEEVLGKTGGLNAYKQKLSIIDSAYSINLQKLVADNLEGEAGIVFTRPNHDNLMDNRFFIMKTHSGSQIEASMQKMVKPLLTKDRKGKLKDLTPTFSLDQETSYKIYQLPVVNFGETLFGSIFAGVPTNYFTVYDNCLIMGASYESICDFLRSDLLEETLQNNQSYKGFISGLSQRFTLFLWAAPGRALPFFRNDLKEGLYKEMENQIESLKKIESVGLQQGMENGLIYNVARLKYNPVVWDRPTTVWRSHLDNPAKSKPQFVIDQNDRGIREIVVQDNDNNLYLINHEGRIIWKLKLTGPILSEIFQVNYFKNKRLQYLFNTSNAIHLIDHDGNYIENYPVKLRAKATNGISVFDYESKLDYRIFVACDDHKVYSYDKNGKIVTGWLPAKTEHDVTKPIQYFRIKSKDYIVYFDTEKTYILDRQGKPRVSFKEKFTHSQNSFFLEAPSGKNTPRLVTTDQEGTIYYLGFDGSVRKFSPAKFSNQHSFLYDDLNNDGNPELFYLDDDSLAAYRFNGKPLFSKKFKYPADPSFNVYTLSANNKKIGINVPEENRIYLFNGDGSIYEGFPLEGNSGFSLGLFKSDSRRFNLIVGSPDGYLNNYLVK